jgi:hypothetical protein
MAQDMACGGGAGGFVQNAPQPEPAASFAVPSRMRELPPDLPDDVQAAVVPEFRSLRKAELLPPIRPQAQSNPLDAGWCRKLAAADWLAGFRWGVVATVGGTCLFWALAVGMLK